MNIYNKYLFVQILFMYFVGAFFGAPGIFIATVLSIVVFFFVREIKK